MKALKITILLILCSFASFAQVNKLGHPLLRNYSPEEYQGSEQNWAIIQDNRGVMYFGNNDRILEYDGVSWRSIAVPKNAPVRSLAKDDKGTIYVGTVGDIGFLAPDEETGLLQFNSLTHLIEDTIVRKKITDIYKTYWFNNKVYFCSLKYICIYDGKTVKSVNLGEQSEFANFFTFIANNHIYIGSYLKGLRELQNDNNVIISKGAEFYVENNIFSIVPLPDSNILMVTKKGLYNYNQITGKSTNFTPKGSYLEELIGSSWPYQGSILSNGTYGIGTVITDLPTFLTADKNGNPINIVNKEIGLQNNFVYYLYQNFNGSLWLAQDLGISKVDIESAIHRFSEAHGLSGIVMDVIRFKDKLYVATTNGVYILKYDALGIPKFNQINESSANTFYVFKVPNSKKKLLLAGAQDGLFEINNETVTEINFEAQKRIQFICYKLAQIPSDSSKLFVCMQGSLAYIENKNGNWIDADWFQKDKISDEIRGVTEDREGNIWLATYLNGLIFAKKTATGYDVVKNYNNGLKSFNNINIYNYSDTIYATTSDGVFRYDDTKNSFVPSNILQGFDLHETKGVYQIIPTKTGYAYSRYKDATASWIETIEKDSLGNNQVISAPYKYLPSFWINSIWEDTDSTIWFCIQKELYSYNPNIKRNYKLPFNALIRKVLSKEDTVLFNGTFSQKLNDSTFIVSATQQPHQTQKFPYRFNKLVFEFSATYFEKEENNVFSYFLQGSDESWSIWNKEAKATYTNLREGNYTFKVKARNIYGTESNIAEYKFSIAPPWYRTILAWIFYSILFIFFVWALVRWNTRRLIEEKERLEQIVKERTAEVVAQKDEISLQSEKISIQNEEIKSSIQYASRIQGAILTPTEQIDPLFNDYFILFLPRDIVSGDFYWISKVGNKKICVVADCTGHGVPGGFMSMLGMSFISQIVSKGGTLHPGDILNQLRSSVINSLHQTGEVGGSKDGMDIAITVYDEVANTLEFSGANNPLVHIRNGELNHIKSDKMPIGIHLRANEPFTTYTIEMQPGDCFYTFSDGYADQFGGPDQRKFMIKNLKDLLLEIHQKPMTEQREILNQTLLDWHGDSPRIDDVVVMGVRV
ncbi:MAG: SpoIIE family protein phosphatase [Tenuifilaceae bacterium]